MSSAAISVAGLATSVAMAIAVTAGAPPEGRHQHARPITAPQATYGDAR